MEVVVFVALGLLEEGRNGIGFLFEVIGEVDYLLDSFRIDDFDPGRVNKLESLCNI